MTELTERARALLAGLPETPWRAIHHSWQESSVSSANEELIASCEVPEIEADDDDWEEKQEKLKALKEKTSEFFAAAPKLVEELADECEANEAKIARLELLLRRKEKRRRGSLHSEMAAYRKLAKAWRTCEQHGSEIQNLKEKVERMKAQVEKAQAERDAAQRELMRVQKYLARVLNEPLDEDATLGTADHDNATTRAALAREILTMIGGQAK